MKAIISFMLLTHVLSADSFEAISQTNPEAKPPSWVGVSVGSTAEGASQELMMEYATIVSSYKTPDKDWWKKFGKNISARDQKRLEQIFKQMSPVQQAIQKVAFIKAPPPLKKVVPSDKEFISWKNPEVYGVWIDGRKVSNTVLDKYRSTDLHQVFVSKLYGVAKQHKNYSYQLNLMTKKYYQKYYEQSTAKEGKRLVFRD